MSFSLAVRSLAMIEASNIVKLLRKVDSLGWLGERPGKGGGAFPRGCNNCRIIIYYYIELLSVSKEEFLIKYSPCCSLLTFNQY